MSKITSAKQLRIELSEKIKELRYSRCYTMAEIAKILDKSDKTIDRYLKQIESEMKQEIKIKKIEDYQMERKISHDNNIKKLW